MNITWINDEFLPWTLHEYFMNLRWLLPRTLHEIFHEFRMRFTMRQNYCSNRKLSMLSALFVLKKEYFLELSLTLMQNQTLIFLKFWYLNLFLRIYFLLRSVLFWNLKKWKILLTYDKEILPIDINFYYQFIKFSL